MTATWAAAVALAGPDPAAWRWADRHTTGSRHPLSAILPDAAAGFDPPRVGVGGEGETLQAAAYGWSGGNDFVITSLSVYRQVVDFADPTGPSYVIPGGASGIPGSDHNADQLELWRSHQRIPMLREDDQALAGAVASIRLQPA